MLLIAQSVLNLNYMAQYKAKFESFASGLASIVNNSTKWNSFRDLLKSNAVREYGDKSFDVYNITGEKSMFEALRNDSTYDSLHSIMDEVDATLDNMLVYEEHGSDIYGCGLCVACPARGKMYKTDYQNTTRFTNWYNFVSTYGSWAH